MNFLVICFQRLIQEDLLSIHILLSAAHRKPVSSLSLCPVLEIDFEIMNKPKDSANGMYFILIFMLPTQFQAQIFVENDPLFSRAGSNCPAFCHLFWGGEPCAGYEINANNNCILYRTLAECILITSSSADVSRTIMVNLVKHRKDTGEIYNIFLISLILGITRRQRYYLVYSIHRPHNIGYGQDVVNAHEACQHPSSPNVRHNPPWPISHTHLAVQTLRGDAVVCLYHSCKIWRLGASQYEAITEDMHQQREMTGLVAVDEDTLFVAGGKIPHLSNSTAGAEMLNLRSHTWTRVAVSTKSSCSTA